MRVLTVFAHPGKKSFCHAVLERFDAGLRDAGHTNEIVDLYAIGFDPVLRERDNPNWMDPNGPDDILAKMHLRERILGLRYPGVKAVEHVYFYAVHGADEAKTSGYLERSYCLGREF